MQVRLNKKNDDYNAEMYGNMLAAVLKEIIIVCLLPKWLMAQIWIAEKVLRFSIWMVSGQIINCILGKITQITWVEFLFVCLFELCFFFIVQNYSHTVFFLSRMLRFFRKVVNEKRDSRFPCQFPFLQHANTIEWHAHDIIVSQKMCKMLHGLESLQFEFQIEEVSRIWFWWIVWLVGFK